MATGHVDLARECLALLPAEDCALAKFINSGHGWPKSGETPRRNGEPWNYFARPIRPTARSSNVSAVLADRENLPDRAAELRDKKTEVDQVNARYKELFLRDQALRDAEEMARLAERSADI